MKEISLNTSYKSHAILATLIGIWLVVFQILISPFDVAELTFVSKLIIIPPYGILFFLSYMAGIYLQNKWFLKSQTWNYKKEIITLSFIFFLLLFLSFSYYKTPLVNGNYSFSKFAFTVYLPILIVFLGIIVVGRIYLNKQEAKKNKSKVLLEGINKSDLLKINPEEIVCISSAQNYVEVQYIKEGKVQKKLLRNTLKKIGNDVPQLLQVHRSHLVNPEHFVKWKNSNVAIFHTLEIPVSKTYQERLKHIIHN